MSINLRKSLLVLGALIVLIAITMVASYLSKAYFDNQYSTDHHGCRPGAPNHTVFIVSGNITPSHVSAVKCDTMTITNQDDTRRLIAFGHHDDHVPYDGIKERYLTKGQTMTVTLDQTGEFLFHDHFHDEVQGTFSVK